MELTRKNYAKSTRALLKAMRGEGWKLRLDKYYGIYTGGKFFPKYEVVNGPLRVYPYLLDAPSRGYQATVEGSGIQAWASRPNTAVRKVMKILKGKYEETQRVYRKAERIVERMK